MVQYLGQEIAREAARGVESTTHELVGCVDKAKLTLDRYEEEVITTQWKVILMSVITTIATCLLLVWLLIPTPTLPLTKEQINDLAKGQMMTLVWPKLTKKRTGTLVGVN